MRIPVIICRRTAKSRSFAIIAWNTKRRHQILKCSGISRADRFLLTEGAVKGLIIITFTGIGNHRCQSVMNIFFLLPVWKTVEIPNQCIPLTFQITSIVFQIVSKIIKIGSNDSDFFPSGQMLPIFILKTFLQPEQLWLIFAYGMHNAVGTVQRNDTVWRK